MRSSVSMAVPLGASSFSSWCSSMISADSNHGAAISAKRIIKIAPMAKFGRDHAVARRELGGDARQVVVGEPGGADDRVDAVSTPPTPGSRCAASRWVKSTTTSGSACAERFGVGQHEQVQVEPGHLPQVETVVVGIGGSDELQVGISRRPPRTPRSPCGRLRRTPRPAVPSELVELRPALGHAIDRWRKRRGRGRRRHCAGGRPMLRRRRRRWHDAGRGRRHQRRVGGGEAGGGGGTSGAEAGGAGGAVGAWLGGAAAAGPASASVSCRLSSPPSGPCSASWACSSAVIRSTSVGPWPLSRPVDVAYVHAPRSRSSPSAFFLDCTSSSLSWPCLATFSRFSFALSRNPMDAPFEPDTKYGRPRRARRT